MKSRITNQGAQQILDRTKMQIENGKLKTIHPSKNINYYRVSSILLMYRRFQNVQDLTYTFFTILKSKFEDEKQKMMAAITEIAINQVENPLQYQQR